MRKLTSILLTASLMLMSVVTTRAGGAFESFDITNAPPSPIAGHLLARVMEDTLRGSSRECLSIERVPSC